MDTQETTGPALRGTHAHLPHPHLPKFLAHGEPRWPAIIAVLAIGTLHMALPQAMSAGPSWLLLAVVVALLIPAVITHRAGKHDLNNLFGHAELAVISGALAWSVAKLVIELPKHTATPTALLRAAAALWVSNVLVFASWYWRLDAGGPNVRDTRHRSGVGHVTGAFLFPQVALDQDCEGPRPVGAWCHDGWRPEFVDYLFLAFCTSTAFSPTDTAVLSRWAKLLVMLQSTISLVAVGVLAARAVNIL